MATFNELFELRFNADLRNKVTVAIVKKAQTLIDISVPSTNQIQWANKALLDPPSMMEKIFPYVLAQNSGASVAAILAATDSAIQTSVDAAVDKFILAGIF